MLGVLKECGYLRRIKIASRVTLEGERLYRDIEAYKRPPRGGYFTVAIVKENMPNAELTGGEG